jgi:DNA repair protein RecN (Recombination protein N)
MLKELYIKNFALIDELTIAFSENLTILSGETGAGKSIIVGALGLVLGVKAKTSFIRTGADYCVVEGRFDVVSSHPVYNILKQRGIEYEPNGLIVLRRIISKDSGSKTFVNGLQVTVRDVQEITALLIDIHGQHEHQSLLNIKNHLVLLDRFGKLQNDLEVYQKSYKRMIDLKAEIKKHTMDEREKERRIDILRYSVKEIDQAQIEEGEEEELEEENKVLKNYEALVSSVTNAYNNLKLDDNSAMTMFEKALTELKKVKEFSSDVAGFTAELETSRFVIEDATLSLKNYIDGIEYDPGKLDSILSRLELIKSLKRKYGDTIQEIKNYGQKCRQELESLEVNEDVINELKGELERELEKARELAVSLSAQRRVCAHALEESVKRELVYLSLQKANFKVNLVYRESDKGQVVIDGKRYELSSSGLDHVEFLISTNVGEPLLPLKSVASGGELSRIMLAIKTVLGNVDPIRTFVFDEIDAGIGGKVAWAVGNRLSDLSKLKQILCITHQAQIASKGDLNVYVTKVSSNKRTITDVKLLNSKEKVQEIARMISGDNISEAAIEQAHQMINN